jgi:hypothetical protein
MRKHRKSLWGVEIANQIGRTVRGALESWPRTVRLICVIFALCVAFAIVTNVVGSTSLVVL